MNPQSVELFFADEAARQAYLKSVDPLCLAFGDDLYAITTLLYGMLLSYHCAGASARYTVDADADHLIGALDLLVDVGAISAKIIHLIGRMSWELLKLFGSGSSSSKRRK